MANNNFNDIDVTELLFSDVNSLITVFNSLSDNYRLLVGAAEELSRTPGAGQRSVNLALDRVDNTGTLIDLVIFSLAIKLDFTTDVLDNTGVPLELITEVLQKILEEDDSEPRDPDNLLPRPDFSKLQDRMCPDKTQEKCSTKKADKGNDKQYLMQEIQKKLQSQLKNKSK